MNTRLENLSALADECMEIYSEATKLALESGDVPRYALMTSEGSAYSSYAANPDLCVYETKAALAAGIVAGIDEGWTPRQVVDLETGADVAYRLIAEID